MRALFLSVCAVSLLAAAPLAGAQQAQTTIPSQQNETPPAIQCVGAEGLVYFDLGSAALNADSQNALSEIAGARNADCSTQITVTGHTDATGSVQRNRQLAQQRADAVKAHLVSLGVPQEEIAVASAAESAPAAQEDRLNRRVAIVLQASPPAPLAQPADAGS